MLCLAVSARESGEPDAAARLLGKCVDICRETADKWVLALALRELGRMAALRNEYALARPPLEESIFLFSELETKHELAATLDDAAAVENADRDHARAAWLWQQAISLWRDLGIAREAANDLHNLGHMARIQGNYGTARLWLSESLNTLRPAKEPELVCDLLREFGALALAQGQTDRAELLYRAADALYVGAAGAEAERATGISGSGAPPVASISEERLSPTPGPGANKKVISLEQVIEYALDEG
jgi:tetratricopeptide (TPR) repeat protein